MFEATPNPNAIKLEIEHDLEVGREYSELNEDTPELIKKILNIEGIFSVFVGPTFLTLIKNKEDDWKDLIRTVEQVL